MTIGKRNDEATTRRLLSAESLGRAAVVVVLSLWGSVLGCASDREQPADAPPSQASFPTEDGGIVHATLYGKGDRGVVLAHGGQFNKESWEEQARALESAGFRVAAIDFRGYGESRGPGDADPLGAPLHLDVLAAVRYLRASGAKSVSVVGASMGGGAAADASIMAEPGEIDRLVLLAASSSGPPEKLKGRLLFIVSEGDTRGDGLVRLTKIRDEYERAPQPKELVRTPGFRARAAHLRHRRGTAPHARDPAIPDRAVNAPG